MNMKNESFYRVVAFAAVIALVLVFLLALVNRDLFGGMPIGKLFAAVILAVIALVLTEGRHRKE